MAGLCADVVLWVPVDCSTLSLHRPGLTWRAGSLAGHSHSAALLPAARRWSPRVTGRREGLCSRALAHSSIKRHVLICESEPWGRPLTLLQQKAEKAETVSFATEGSETEH